MATIERRSAVSFYPSDHPSLNITVKSRLMNSLRELEENLALGLAQDWPDYKFRCGRADGLREAIAECDRVLREMSER